MSPRRISDMHPTGGKEWVVLLEADRGDDPHEFDRNTMQRLLAAVAHTRPSSLHTENRYVLQMFVEATNPPAALLAAFSLWGDALVQLDLPAWDVVRTEVLTPDELARDHQDQETVIERPALVAYSPGHAASDDLLRRALCDPWSGLPGRELFCEEVRARPTGDGRIGSGPGGFPAGADPDDDPSAAPVRAVVILGLDGDREPAGLPGPSVRNAVLARIAATLGGIVRPTDVLGHLDEGLAVFATLPAPGLAVHLAERVLASARSVLCGERHPAALTASVGIATGGPESDVEALVDEAVGALAAAMRPQWGETPVRG